MRHNWEIIHARLLGSYYDHVVFGSISGVVCMGEASNRALHDLFRASFGSYENHRT